MALSILLWQNFCDSKKLSRKSELTVQADRVLKFSLDSNMVNGQVQASMKDRSYKDVKVWIQLTSDETVGDSNCECVNGKEKCSHKASLLLYGYKNVSKTDVRQSWIKHPKSAPPKVPHTMEELFTPPERLKNYRATSRPVSEHDRNFLYTGLKGLGRYSAMQWMLAPEPNKPSLPVPIIQDLIANADFLAAHDKEAWLRRQLLVDDQVISQVAMMTAGQRDNRLWSAVRKFRLTSSQFGPVLRAIERKRFPPSLFRQLTGAYNLEKRDPIVWGITNEAVAIEKYCTLGAVVQETGVWLHPSGVLGASPDAIIKKAAELTDATQPKVMPGVLEVKCPYTARDLTIKEAVSQVPGFCLESDESGCGFRLKRDHSYFHQIQGQIYLSQSEACDLIVWTKEDFAVLRILREPQWSANLDILVTFFFESYLPHLQQL